MRRPLCFACLTLILCLAFYGWLHPPSYVSYGEACGGEVVLTGRVYAKESKGGSRQILSLFIEPEALFYQKEETPFQNNFICIMQENVDVSIGSTVVVSGILREPEPASNPGQFDARLYYATLDISAKLQKARLLFSDGKKDFFRELLWEMRQKLSGALETIFTSEDAAILKTMLLGDKSTLEEEVKTLYKEAGILHILAISGLHISLIGLGLYRLLKKMRLPTLPAALVCGSCMLFYGMLTGMSVSCVRAISMFLLRLLADSIGRTYDMLTAIAVCGAAMLVRQPLYLYHSGFLLSFLAVLAILILKPAILPKEWQKKPLADAFFTTLSVSVFTLPIQLIFFSETSVYAVFLNLAVVPLVGVVMILGICGMVLYFFLPVLTAPVVIPVHSILASYESGAAFIGNLAGSRWTPGKPAFWQIAAFCLLVGMVLCCGKLAWRYKMGLLCGALLLFGIREHGALQVTFLDVGQGDCICVELPGGGAWLFDGGSTSVSDVGSYRLSPFLKSRGITTLEAVFLSHEDADHINGVEELLAEEKIRINLLVLPHAAQEGMFENLLDLAAKREIPVLWMQEGMTWEKNGVSARCLHPGAASAGAGNNADSLVIYLTYGDFSLLLTGDVEGEGEDALLAACKSMQITDITVLKVAHHGSRNSTGEAFCRL